MKHQTISFIKSGLRIVGYALILASLEWAIIFLVASEILGIVEEIGHD